jgi:tripeptidyl-peptidase-2
VPQNLCASNQVRQFVAVPAGATWAEVSVRAGAYDAPRVFLIRATQVVPDVRYTDSELRTNLTLAPNSEWATAFKVCLMCCGCALALLTVLFCVSSCEPDRLPCAVHGLPTQVVGETSLELTLSQFWSSLGASSIDVELSFHGIGVTPAAAATGSTAGVAANTMLLDAAAGPLKVGVFERAAATAC